MLAFGGIGISKEIGVKALLTQLKGLRLFSFLPNGRKKSFTSGKRPFIPEGKGKKVIFPFLKGSGKTCLLIKRLKTSAGRDSSRPGSSATGRGNLFSEAGKVEVLPSSPESRRTEGIKGFYAPVKGFFRCFPLRERPGQVAEAGEQ